VTHDFDKLRAERNAAHLESRKRLAAEYGIKLDAASDTFDPNACYCACGTGGPCEHKWDGAPVQGDTFFTMTCSRCGCTALGHDMRYGP
jgi:hypothetical protein